MSGVEPELVEYTSSEFPTQASSERVSRRSSCHSSVSNCSDGSVGRFAGRITGSPDAYEQELMIGSPYLFLSTRPGSLREGGAAPPPRHASFSNLSDATTIDSEFNLIGNDTEYDNWDPDLGADAEENDQTQDRAATPPAPGVLASQPRMVVSRVSSGAKRTTSRKVLLPSSPKRCSNIPPANVPPLMLSKIVKQPCCQMALLGALSNRSIQSIDSYHSFSSHSASAFSTPLDSARSLSSGQHSFRMMTTNERSRESLMYSSDASVASL